MIRKALLTAQTTQAIRENETEAQKNKRKHEEKRNKRLLYMTFDLSIFSAVNHALKFAAQFTVFILTLNRNIGAQMIFTHLFDFSLQNVANIFFFYN